MAWKNITNKVFLNTKKVGLNRSLEATFVTYTWIYLHNASSIHVQVIRREEVSLYHECYVLHCCFKHSQ